MRSFLTGSSLLPHQSRQPPPEGTHAPPDFAGEPPVAKGENFCSTRFQPQRGHSGGSWLRVNTSFSKMCPQWEQAYSKMGMGKRSHSLGLMSQASCLGFPAGVLRRPAQVKRERPGIRGRTTNQTTRMRTRIKKFVIFETLSLHRRPNTRQSAASVRHPPEVARFSMGIQSLNS